MSFKILLAAAVAAGVAGQMGAAARLVLDTAGSMQAGAVQVPATLTLHRAAAVQDAPPCQPTAIGAHGPATILRIGLCGDSPERFLR